MPTATTRSSDTTPTLHLAPDLGNTTWKLAFATGHAHAPRLRTMPARDLAQLAAEIAAAKARFGLPADAPVVSCYEAGRDGFWVHRALTALGVHSIVVDSASIGQNRRKRRAKSDRLDATALVRLLLRHHGGERGVWSVVHVPSVEEEDRRHLHRELFTLTRERTRQMNRIKSLLALHGSCCRASAGCPSPCPCCATGTARRCPPA
jgi:transposase